MKLLTITVPCYNSASYMEHCIQTLLSGGDEVEILLIDDGSTDETPAIADRYAAEYPEIVRVIHQPNGGHGEGVNQGIRNAKGLYFKVVDSDDWLDVPSLQKALRQLRIFANSPSPVDLMISNFVYEHMTDNTQHAMRYRNVFPKEQLFTWEDIGHFRPSQYLLMHSVIYRTELLRGIGLELPKHTFYVDNIFVYEPLPAVKSVFYLDVDLYRYFIGRADQSVNENVMVGRVDQQLRVTRLMIDSHDLGQVRLTSRKLAHYMFNYLAMMMMVSSIFLIISGTPESLQKKVALWEYLRKADNHTYYRMRYASLCIFMNIPGYQGRRLSKSLYRASRKVFKFN